MMPKAQLVNSDQFAEMELETHKEGLENTAAISRGLEQSHNVTAPAGADEAVKQAAMHVLNLIKDAHDNSSHVIQEAVGVAQKLSRRAERAEARIAELEAENGNLRMKLVQAEQWMQTVAADIEKKFLTPQRAFMSGNTSNVKPFSPKS